MKRNIDHEEKEESSDDTRAIIAQKKVKREAKNPNHVQLSDAIWIFFDQKLSDHANIFNGKQLHGHFASLPVVVKLVDNTEHNKRESRILSKLNHHSNVISLIESGFYDGALESFIYIVLDKCHHENLRHFVESRSGISLDRKLGIVSQIITGVEYIHGKDIAHLDLKPENILFTIDQQTIKIADFGLSEEMTKRKVFVKFQFGTNGYRPPESFGNSYISLKSDIFSLGAVFYFILSDGKNPFGEDPDGQNSNMKNGKIDLSCLLVPNYETTKHLLQNMLKLARNRRPTISQVCQHPFWTGKEVECDFDYETAEDSKSSDDEKEEDEQQQQDNLSDLPTLLALLKTYSTEDDSLTGLKVKASRDDLPEERTDHHPRQMIYLGHTNKETQLKIQGFQVFGSTIRNKKRRSMKKRRMNRVHNQKVQSGNSNTPIFQWLSDNSTGYFF